MGKFLLTFVRHGETEYNRKGLLQGQIDIPLNETGLKQADALGRHLANERFDHVYSSDLSRCVETAEGVIRNGAIQRPSIVKDARLRERNFGEAEGMAADVRKSGQDPEGAESRKQVIDRGLSFIHDLCLNIHREYGHDKDYQAKMAKNADPSKPQMDEGKMDDDSFEVVFTTNDSALDDNSSSTEHTERTVLGTELNDQEHVSTAQKEGCGTAGKVNTQEDASKSCSGSGVSTTPGAVGGNTENSHEISSIFKSDIAGTTDIPSNCPHILVSSHGFFLRVLFQALQKQYKLNFPSKKSIFRMRCPNTGLSSFVVTLDNDGLIQDIECDFVYSIDHLDGVDFIQYH